MKREKNRHIVTPNDKNSNLTNQKISTKILGDKGEELATKYLIRQGYVILDRNWRWQRAELDIVCMDKQSLVIVEVRTRSYNNLGEPEESITVAKEEILMDAARQYALNINHEWEVRIDIIAIIYNKRSYQLRHIKDAIF